MFPNVYKCARGIIPRATAAVFILNENSELEFKEVFKDDPTKLKSGYTSWWKGDSGSPIWVHEPIIPYAIKNRAVLVSMVEGRRREYMTNVNAGIISTEKKCDLIHTKITEELLDWIKTKAKINQKTVRKHEEHENN